MCGGWAGPVGGAHLWPGDSEDRDPSGGDGQEGARLTADTEVVRRASSTVGP